MSAFTEEELQFLRKHRFSEDEVHDGRFQTKTGREMAAKAAGKILVLSNTKCRAMGHRLRTRAGHCIQCNPTNIAFTARESSRGNVYIAGSLSGRVIKIGAAKDIAQRERQLRAERYGGFADWSILLHLEVDNVGKIERDISSRISGNRVFNDYVKDGREQLAIEIIRCSFSDAFRAFSECVGGIERARFWMNRNRQYEFD